VELSYDEYLDLAGTVEESSIARRGGLAGAHRQPAAGESPEFREYRPYVPGLDARRIDQRLYARKDLLYVKTFEDEKQIGGEFWIDESPSMEWAGKGAKKADRARSLAIVLALYHLGMQDPAYLWNGDERKLFQGSGGGIALYEMLDGKRPSFRPRIEPPSRTIRNVYFFGDFLSEEEEIFGSLSAFSDRGYRVFVHHMIDPLEWDPEFPPRSLLIDPEDKTRLPYDEKTLTDYKERFRSHVLRIEDLCSERGINYTIHRTSEELRHLAHRA